MNYVSTRNKSKTFKFKDVFLKVLADDGGLFVPEVEFKEKYNNLDIKMDLPTCNRRKTNLNFERSLFKFSSVFLEILTSKAKTYF